MTHQMKTFNTFLASCAGNSPVTAEFPSRKGKWRGALEFTLISPEQTVEQTVETPMICDATALIMTSL